MNEQFQPTPAFIRALAREIAIAHNGPSYWDRLNEAGREYWYGRVRRNIEDAHRALAEQGALS